MAIGRRRRFRNPKGGGFHIAHLLPWVAIGGLVYLMAQNSAKVKAAAGAAPAPAPACAGGVTNDFGVTGCWCSQ